MSLSTCVWVWIVHRQSGSNELVAILFVHFSLFPCIYIRHRHPDPDLHSSSSNSSSIILYVQRRRVKSSSVVVEDDAVDSPLPANLKCRLHPNPSFPLSRSSYNLYHLTSFSVLYPFLHTIYYIHPVIQPASQLAIYRSSIFSSHWSMYVLYILYCVLCIMHHAFFLCIM